VIRSGCVVAAWLAGLTAGAFAQERVVTLESRPGVALRVLVNVPASPPHGSVILLAGSHGNLQLSDDGRLGWGAGNQLVRTRSEYARAGFVTALPDVAEDLRRPAGGAVDGYRWSEAHARATSDAEVAARGDRLAAAARRRVGAEVAAGAGRCVATGRRPRPDGGLPGQPICVNECQ
jgi:hypothetical protein